LQCAVDLYPEFTGTAMSTTVATQMPRRRNEVKDYYSKNLKLTWLDAAFNLKR
jgi:glycine betaine/choline ABC-type transport system substrate-binding protein